MLDCSHFMPSSQFWSFRSQLLFSSLGPHQVTLLTQAVLQMIVTITLGELKMAQTLCIYYYIPMFYFYIYSMKQVLPLPFRKKEIRLRSIYYIAQSGQGYDLNCVHGISFLNLIFFCNLSQHMLQCMLKKQNSSNYIISAHH